jgi:hypothetical protein
VPGEPKRKRQKPDNAGPNSFKKAHPVNELKNQIRALKRLLERNENLPATVRVEKERALRSAQHELEQTERAKQRNEIIGRYHKIRFFDRQKATKRLKQARKRLSNFDGDEDSRVNLARRVDDAEVDVNYAQYFPLEQHYVSLFPRKRDDEDEEDSRSGTGEQDMVVERKGDQEMWQRVKQCMADGTLDDLRNGRLSEGDEVEDGEPAEGVVKMSRKDGTNKTESAVPDLSQAHKGKRIQKPKDDDDESDGGFFE